MNRTLSAMILIGAFSLSTNALAARISGKVTENDGTTPIPNIYVDA
jgi:hypothetical protein